MDQNIKSFQWLDAKTSEGQKIGEILSSQAYNIDPLEAFCCS